jgi:nucleoside-diphosphate-sugar epimerase
VAPVRSGCALAARAGLRQGGVIVEDGRFHERAFAAALLQRYAVRQVVHLAAVRGAGSRPEAYRMINSDATRMLLEESLRAGVERFVLCSSVGVWGTVPVRVPPDARTPYVADTLYHASKIEGEKAAALFRGRGLATVIVRPTITYGPGDSGFPATLVNLVRRRRFVRAMPDVRVHLVSVHAAADCIARIALAPHPPDDLYVVLDREPVTLGALADCIHRHFYNRPYPRALSVPRGVFRAADWLCGLLRSEVWKVRMQLVSRDWYYAPLGSYAKLCYSPPDTLDAFTRYLQAQWPAAGG